MGVIAKLRSRTTLCSNAGRPRSLVTGKDLLSLSAMMVAMANTTTKQSFGTTPTFGTVLLLTEVSPIKSLL